MTDVRKVAILQHDCDSAELSRLLLEPLGHEVQVFWHADDPLTRIVVYRPDVLVMDFCPYRVHCWNLLKAIAENPDTAYLPVVAIAVERSIIDDLLTYANVSQTILAPYDIEELVGKVEAAASHRWHEGMEWKRA